MSFVQSVVRPVRSRPGRGAERPEIPGPGVRRPRLYVLDLLRLVAALGVMLWHFAGDEGWSSVVWGGRTSAVLPRLHAIGNYTWIGVELFFLISGFVVCMSSWGRTSGAFFRSRVVRLFPAYWVGIVISGVLLLRYAPTWYLDAKSYRYSDVLTNLTMVQEGLSHKNVDPVTWTLWVELRFYVLFGLLVAFGLTYKRVVAFCGFWTFAAVLATATRLPLLDLLFFPEYSSFFVAGIAMYLMHRYGPDLLLWGIVGFSWLFAQYKLHDIITGYQWLTDDELSYTVLLALTTLAFVVILGVALGWFQWVKWRGLTVLGALTYPLYLLHQMVGGRLLTELRGRVSPHTALAVTTATVLLASWLVHRYVERPGSALLDRGLRKSFERMRAIDAREAAEKRERAAAAPHPGEEQAGAAQPQSPPPSATQPQPQPQSSSEPDPVGAPRPQSVGAER